MASIFKFGGNLIWRIDTKLNKIIPFFIKKLKIIENNHETFVTPDTNIIFILQILAFENIFSTTVTRKATNITKK